MVEPIVAIHNFANAPRTAADCITNSFVISNLHHVVLKDNTEEDTMGGHVAHMAETKNKSVQF